MSAIVGMTVGVAVVVHAIIWHHCWAWRRMSRRGREEAWRDHVAFNRRCPALATPGTSPEPDDGRDWLRALRDVLRFWPWLIARGP